MKTRKGNCDKKNNSCVIKPFPQKYLSSNRDKNYFEKCDENYQIKKQMQAVIIG